VEDLCEIAEFVDNPYTEKQKVHIGFLILSTQPIFRSDLRKWMRMPAPDKTWLNFIDHFRMAHQELRDTNTSMEELGYQSANAIVKQIVDRLRDADEQVPPPQQASYRHPYEAPSYAPEPAPPTFEAPPYPPPPPLPAPMPQANAVVPVDPNATALQAMMQNMQLMHDAMHQQYSQGRGRGRGRGGGRGRGRGRTPGRGPDRQSRGGKYCHTHGNCAHSGSECRTPGPTHSNEAMFANMMGGSTAQCYWINQ
jgi:hypothetical protein